MKCKPYDFIARFWVKIPPSLRNVIHCISPCNSLEKVFLPDRLEVVDIKGGIAKGMKMRLNLRQERSYYFGIHESDVQLFLTEVVRPGMNVYNIGAHIGFFTLGLSQIVAPTGKVVSFEPNPEVRKRLIDHLSLNGLDNCVSVEEYALSDFDGFAKFSLSLSDTQGRFDDLPYVKQGNVIQVQCKCLDTYVAEKGHFPDLVLMDVEHAEGRALRGMAEILEHYKPLIVIEMHGPASIKEAWDELKRHNYFIANLQKKIISSLDRVSYGHFFAAHVSYFNLQGKSTLTNMGNCE